MKCCAGFFAHTVILHLIFPLVKTCIAITNVVLDDHVLRSSGNYQLFQLSFSAMLDFYIGKILGTRLSEVSGVTKVGHFARVPEKLSSRNWKDWLSLFPSSFASV